MPWYIIGYFLLGGYRVARSLVVAQVRDLVALANMGLAFGVAETISGTALILAAPLAGYLYDINPEMIYPLAIIMVAVSMLVSSVTIPQLAVQTNHTT